MFSFRRAEIADKNRICEISSKIWEGTDYIPIVFDEWVSEREGEFTVAEYEGEIVGFAKYSRIVNNEAWLEGIRADQSISGKGFGDAMTSYFINKAKNEKLGSLSLSTYIENYQSIKIIERNNFKRDAYFSYCNKELKSDNISKAAVNAVKIMSTATAWSFIESSRAFILSNGYISKGWHFYKLNYEMLDRLIKTEKVIGIIRNGTITAMAILMGELGLDKEISIGFLDGEDIDRNNLLNHLEKMALEVGVQTVEFMSVLDQDLIDILINRGYQFEYDKPRQANVYVYTYQIK